jgi:hypothetical protein
VVEEDEEAAVAAEAKKKSDMEAAAAAAEEKSVEAAAAYERELNRKELEELEAEGVDEGPGVEERAEGGDGDGADANAINAARVVNMLECCRSVEEFERLNRIDEGAYGACSTPESEEWRTYRLYNEYFRHIHLPLEGEARVSWVCRGTARPCFGMPPAAASPPHSLVGVLGWRVVESNRRCGCWGRSVGTHSPSLTPLWEVAGPTGVVYRARDKKSGRVLALKKVKMEKEKEGFPLTSIREINILLSLDHPNIIDVTEVRPEAWRW